MEVKVTQDNFIASIPKLPGVYRFYAATAAQKELLYVGKAINLYNRVKSYFLKSAKLSPRISLMVAKIESIEITITADEAAALILENNLIKSLKPKYNIIFRDDKSYPLIRITKHQFPRLESYRGKPNKQDIFFGPYPNLNAIKESLDLINKIFKLRTCSDVVFNNRQRPCILYQIKRCSAPCVNYISDAEYNHHIALASDYLNGKYSRIIDDLTKSMYHLADQMEFEQAAKMRDKLVLIKQVRDSQIINDYNKPVNSDLIFCENINEKTFIYLIIVRNGIYIGDKHYILHNNGNSLDEVLQAFIESNYLNSTLKTQIYTSCEFKHEFLKVFTQITQISINNQFPKSMQALYKMGLTNLNKIIEQNMQLSNLHKSEVALAQLLNLPAIQRIECIDISHNHGENTVGSLVVYENSIIDHSKYRLYNINKDSAGNLINGNDLQAMATLLRRRFNNNPINIPQIIIIDGGKIQLETVKNILIEVGLYGKITGLAIVKGDKRAATNDRVLLTDGRIINYEYNNTAFKLVQALRDEAHRFAITGHRKKQIKKMSYSSIDEIPNIGAKKKRDLIAYFGSVNNIATASVKQLTNVAGVGEKIAQQIYSYFH
ncbi:MAG: excinuclease ABC subunit UvrC [Burkholderiales bacterium]|nr:excinuclease ABC subunit UvrC [Burkholderiales bacterium]